MLSLLFAIFLFACNGKNDGLYLEATGTIESINVTISSKNPGEIKALLSDEGSLVKSGDTIIVIDNEALNYQLDQACANEQIAQAQLSLMIKGARIEDIRQAEELLKQSEVNFDLAKNDYDRFTKLRETEAVTQKQFEEIKTRYEIFLAQFNSAKENYEKVKNIFRSEEIEQVKANLKKAKASVELLKKSIRDSYVISPIDGFIVKRFVEVGETVTPMSSLIKISNLAKVNLIIYISESDLGKVRLGQKAEITIDTFHEKTYEGKIIFISPEAEFTPKNIQTKDERTKLVFAVKIKIPNDNYDLKPGMPADAKIKLQD